jgi:Uma2 family endonuclease
MLMTLPKTAEEIEYPDSDGKPMAESDTHRDVMADALIFPLKEYYRQRSDVYVTGNLLLYYQKGNPRVRVAPDVFVVFGVPNRERRTYKLWEEGKAPDVVFEITSKSTRKEDLRDKRYLYEEWGVQEYFLFDPLREYLKPPLQGFRLQRAYFIPLEPQPLPDDEWQLESKVLGLLLQTQDSMLRLYDPQTGQCLRTHREEADARRAAEAELARLRALLDQQNQ